MAIIGDKPLAYTRDDANAFVIGLYDPTNAKLSKKPLSTSSVNAQWTLLTLSLIWLTLRSP